MHDTALRHANLFYKVYASNMSAPDILEVGSQDVNGSIRNGAPADANYVGADFVGGPGVDVVLGDAYNFPFDDKSFDICVSSSCLEHSQFFWLTFLEMTRIVRSGGLIYINVPSNGLFHQYPYDCWRFYPDSGLALQDWAQRNGRDAILLESFVGGMKTGNWADFISVYVVGREFAHNYPNSIMDHTSDFTNGRRFGHDEIIRRKVHTEDQMLTCARIRRWLNSSLGRPD